MLCHSTSKWRNTSEKLKSNQRLHQQPTAIITFCITPQHSPADMRKMGIPVMVGDYDDCKHACACAKAYGDWNALRICIPPCWDGPNGPWEPQQEWEIIPGKKPGKARGSLQTSHVACMNSRLINYSACWRFKNFGQCTQQSFGLCVELHVLLQVHAYFSSQPRFLQPNWRNSRRTKSVSNSDSQPPPAVYKQPGSDFSEAHNKHTADSKQV